jgi:hypothetical protein
LKIIFLPPPFIHHLLSTKGIITISKPKRPSKSITQLDSVKPRSAATPRPTSVFITAFKGTKKNGEIRDELLSLDQPNEITVSHSSPGISGSATTITASSSAQLTVTDDPLGLAEKAKKTNRRRSIFSL